MADSKVCGPGLMLATAFSDDRLSMLRPSLPIASKIVLGRKKKTNQQEDVQFPRLNRRSRKLDRSTCVLISLSKACPQSSTQTPGSTGCWSGLWGCFLFFFPFPQINSSVHSALGGGRDCLGLLCDVRQATRWVECWRRRSRTLGASTSSPLVRTTA